MDVATYKLDAPRPFWGFFSRRRLEL